MIWGSLLLGGTYGFRYFFGEIPLVSFCDGAIGVLMVVQLIIIVPGGCNSIHRAIVRDTETRMIESHRISPISGWQMLTGYLVGPNLHILVIFALNAAAGAVIIRWGTIGAKGWLVGNAMLLVATILPWSATVLIGVGRIKPVNPMAILALFFFLAPALFIIPGLGVFTGFYAHALASLTMVGDPKATSGTAMIAMLVNTGAAVIWGRAAMRKYRRPDLPAFGTVRAFGLLLLWLLVNAAALAAAGLAVSGRIAFMGGPIDRDFVAVSLLATVCATLFVSLLPLVALAHARVRSRKGRWGDPGGVRLGMGVGPVCCAALALSFIVFHTGTVEWATLLLTMVAISASLTAIEAMLTWSFARSKTPFRAAALFVFICWVTPVVGDGLYRQFAAIATHDFERHEAPTFMAAISPAAHLMQLFEFDAWDAEYDQFRDPVMPYRLRSLLPGTLVQIGIAVLMVYVARRAVRAPDSAG